MNSSGDRLLIIDNDPWMRETLAELLQTAGLEVAGAADAADALRCLRSRPAPDLVFCDLRVANGWMAATSLQENERYRRVPVAVYSDDPHGEVLAHSLGAAHFLRKPVDAVQLFALLPGRTPVPAPLASMAPGQGFAAR